MVDLEKIDKGLFNLWRGDGWFCFTQFLKPKRLKFFLANTKGEYRVKHKEKVVYQGTDLEKAIDIYNSI